MMTMKMIVAIGLMGLAGTVLAGVEADWLCYPGDYGIWRGNRLMSHRLIWTGRQSPGWGVYGHWPSVAFRKTATLERDETIRIVADGTYFLTCRAARNHHPPTRFGEVTIPAGTNVTLEIRVFNDVRPPTLKVEGRAFATDAGWTAAWHRDDSVPAETVAVGGDVPPTLRTLPVRPVEPVKTWRDAKGRLFADFGRETYGYLKLREVRGAGVVRIAYAESLPEAEAEDRDDGTVKTALDGSEYLRLSACDEHRREFPNGFRYICVRTVEGDVSVGSLAMDYEWKPVPLRGAFRCDDEELNRIWDVSVRTLELTRREIFVEGIKRDHWTWSGDAVQSFLMDYYTAADYTGVRDTLWVLRGKDPVLSHLNWIMDYTFYWFDAVKTYELYTGDTRFLGQVYPRMKSLMEWCIGRLDEKGRPHDCPGDWMFIDWAPEPLENHGGVTSFEEMLLVRALEATAAVAERVGQTDDAASYRARAAALKQEIKTVFWDEGKGCLAHILRDDGSRSERITRYPNMFGLLFGYFDGTERERVVKNVILNDEVMRIQTPYMRFYELESLCAIGLQERVLKEMKDYWGAMLRLGATSFWELYNPTESGNQHYAMYGRNFGRSLCHAWGASPVYLLGRYYLGVTPTAPGFATYEVRPALGGLAWMTGKVPTPHGEIEVSVRDGEVAVKGVPNCTGTLRWNGKTAKIPPSGEAKLK